MDRLLVDVVRVVENRKQSAVMVTLVVDGAVVTGLMVCFKEFMYKIGDKGFELVSERDLGAAARGGAAAMRFGTKWAEEYQDSNEPLYLHLVNVGVHVSGIVSELPFLRVSIKSVSAWTLGEANLGRDG